MGEPLPPDGLPPASSSGLLASITSRHAPQITWISGLPHTLSAQEGQTYFVLLAAFFWRPSSSPEVSATHGMVKPSASSARQARSNGPPGWRECDTFCPVRVPPASPGAEGTRPTASIMAAHSLLW